jgi:hypothetical protein
MTLIHIEDLSKHFKTLSRREGLSGAFYPSQLFRRPEDVAPLIYFSSLASASSH